MAEAAKRKSGRPARLSRDVIVDAAVGLLEKKPEEALTAARVAKAVGAVPAALYRHFESLDALSDEILGRILGDVEIDTLGKTRWEDQLADWMAAVRRQVLRYPALGQLIGRLGRTSPAWLELCAIPVEILRNAGIPKRQLPATHLWICETTMAVAIQEATFSLEDQIRGAHASVDSLSEAGRERLESVLRDPSEIDGDVFFSFMIDRTIDGVRGLLKAKRRPRSSR